MTAVLVLQCRDDGLLDLDDPIGTHLPGDRVRRRHDAPAARARLRHAERAGRAVVGAVTGRAGRPAARRQRRVRRGVRAEEHYHYSNLGFALLGEVVARLRGEPWMALVQSRILDPLGMRRTSYLPEEPHAQGFSVHHLRGTLTEEPAHDTGAMAPAGQLWSTIEDLARFAAFVSLGNPAVLADESLAEMRQPRPTRRRTTAWVCGWCRGPAACSPATPARCPASRRRCSPIRSPTSVWSR